MTKSIIISKGKDAKRKALFFLRHYNDIDHIVPVVFKWLTTGDDLAHIIVTTNLEYMNDYRIQFLRKFENLQIQMLDDFLSHEQLKKKKATLLRNKLSRFHPTRLWLDTKRRLFNVSEIEYNNEFANKLLDEVFTDIPQGIVVFDWPDGKIDPSFAPAIVDASRKRSFASISLPHGDAPHYGRMYYTEHVNYNHISRNAPDTIFDYFVVPNELSAQRYRHHIKASKIKILGSPRFNTEWLEIINSIVPSKSVKSASGKLKIVFFLRNKYFPIFWEEVGWTIRLVTQFSGVHLIVKTHSRGRIPRQLKRVFSRLKDEKIPNLDIVYDEIHSGSLLSWADLVMDLGTSIVFQAVKLDKPVLAMEYLHANFTTIAHYMKNSIVLSREQLYDTIQTFIKNPDHKFYDKVDRQRFIEEMIDVPDPNVLERYIIFLRGCFPISE